MNAQNLFQQKDGQFVPTCVWACQCGIIHHTQEGAEACCKWVCRKCGQPVCNQFQLECQLCTDLEFRKREAQREAERYAKAQKLTSWDGPVFDGDRFHEDLEAFFENQEYVDHEEPSDRPAYVWACHVRPTVQCDVQEMIESIEWPEGQEDAELEGRAELDAAVEAFNQLNSQHKSWDPDYTRAVVLSWPEERL